MNLLYRQACSLIQKAETVILHRHNMPDGDAVGAQVGLRNILKDNFPEKRIYIVGDPASRFAYVPGSAPQTVPDEVFADALCIILDCGAKSMISDPRWEQAPATLRFDHHLFQETVAQVDIVDPGFESTCGLVTDFALSTGLTVTARSALPLYLGMVTDSGRFRYDSTTPRTLRLAAELLSHGIDTNELYRNLYSSTIEEVRQRALFTMKIRYTEAGVAYLYNTAAEIAELGMSLFDVSRGMIGVMSDLKGVDIWANFTESPDGLLAELRSSRYNIQPIAVKYGGGGHEKACGATLKDADEMKALLADLDEILKSAGRKRS